MKRILLLITKADIGGAQVSTFLLAKELKKHGTEITLGVGRQGTFLTEKLNKISIELHTFKYLQRGLKIFSNIAFIFELKKFINKNNFDVIHLNSSNTLFGAIGAKLANKKIKVIFTHRGLSIIDPGYTRSLIKRKLNIFLFKFLLRFVDVQIFVSKKNQDDAHTMHIAKNDIVIYNGLNPESLLFFTKDNARKKISELINQKIDRKIIIGSIGRLAYQKNYEFLISEIQRLKNDFPNIICIIIGDGPEKNNLDKLIKNLRLENTVFFTGPLHDAADLISAFDIFVLPSRYEGLSITLIEALFAGVPIVASDVGGNKETIESAGFLYPLNDKKIFQNIICKLASSESLRAEYSNRAKTRATFFTIDKTVEEYIKVYNKIE